LLKGESYLIKWSRLRFIIKLKKTTDIKKAFKKEKVLFTILSIKMGRPVLFNYPNLLGILNNAMEYYRESGDLIIKSLDIYNQFNKLIEMDSKEVFVRKLEEYEMNKPFQDEELEYIVKVLFPDLD
jgi:hypothetical protein